MSPVQRLMTCVDSASGVSAALDPGEWSFLNTELTVHVLRPPVGEWVCLDAETTLGPRQRRASPPPGCTTPSGLVARSAQALLVAAPLRAGQNGPGGDEVADPERVVAVGHRRDRRRPARPPRPPRAAAAPCCRAPSAPRRARRRGRAGRPRPRRPARPRPRRRTRTPARRGSPGPSRRAGRCRRRAPAAPCRPGGRRAASARAVDRPARRRARRRRPARPGRPSRPLEQPPRRPPATVGSAAAGGARARRTEAADVGGGVRGPVAGLVVGRRPRPPRSAPAVADADGRDGGRAQVGHRVLGAAELAEQQRRVRAARQRIAGECDHASPRTDPRRAAGCRGCWRPCRAPAGSRRPRARGRPARRARR